MIPRRFDQNDHTWISGTGLLGALVAAEDKILEIKSTYPPGTTWEEQPFTIAFREDDHERERIYDPDHTYEDAVIGTLAVVLAAQLAVLYGTAPALAGVFAAAGFIILLENPGDLIDNSDDFIGIAVDKQKYYEATGNLVTKSHALLRGGRIKAKSTSSTDTFQPATSSATGQRKSSTDRSQPPGIPMHHHPEQCAADRAHRYHEGLRSLLLGAEQEDGEPGGRSCRETEVSIVAGAVSEEPTTQRFRFPRMEARTRSTQLKHIWGNPHLDRRTRGRLGSLSRQRSGTKAGSQNCGESKPVHS
ncbi:MAG: hypothetical protein ACREF4_13075 [Gammaproteobacteria bacterium]